MRTRRVGSLTEEDLKDVAADLFQGATSQTVVTQEGITPIFTQAHRKKNLPAGNGTQSR